jgi:DNA polymerase I-like protein with 3'-5' exonuclease and polymerase domains
MNHTERIVRSERDEKDVCNAIKMAGPDARVVYDVETGCSPEMDEKFGGKGSFYTYCGAYLTGMSVCIVHPYQWEPPVSEPHSLTGWYIPLGHERGNVSERCRRGITKALAITDATHVGHNTPFDWAFLLNEGLLLDVPVRAHDTQIKRWLQDENGTKKLKVLGEMWLGEDASTEQRGLHELMAAPYSKITDARAAVREAYPEMRRIGKSGKPLQALDIEGELLAAQLRINRRWGQLTVDELGRYAARDATLTAEIDHLLDGQSPAATIEREMKVNAICIDMTRRGLYVDIPQLHRAGAIYRGRSEALQAELESVHALENPGSSDQVAELLYDRLGLPVLGRTPSGEPSTGKNTLEQLAGDPVAGKILEYRKWVKADTAYAKPFALFAESGPDERIHGMFRTTGTVTGRLAASGPNVMTIPREDSLPELRAAFNVAPPGMERIGFDIDGAELWVTASLTGDPVLTAILQEGRSVHTEMMLQVFGGEPDKSRREYTLSKNVNFGIEYGAGLDQITIFAAKAGYPPAEARRVAQIARDGHKRMFKVQHERADWWSAKSQELGKLPVWKRGRYRHFRSPGKLVPGYTALNALVQGGVGEFVKDTMIELYARGYGEWLILQVHDELVFDVPAGKGYAEELYRLLNLISAEINPFKYQLHWSPKSWSMAA